MTLGIAVCNGVGYRIAGIAFNYRWLAELLADLPSLYTCQDIMGLAHFPQGQYWSVTSAPWRDATLPVSDARHLLTTAKG